jgi:hypothetical protein
VQGRKITIALYSSLYFDGNVRFVFHSWNPLSVLSLAITLQSVTSS